MEFVIHQVKSCLMVFPPQFLPLKHFAHWERLGTKVRTYVWAIYLLVRARRMEKDAFRRSLCTVVYVTCHVRGCCNLHLTSPTRHLYVVCTYLVLGRYSSSVRGRGLNQYWWPPKDHHSLLVLLRKTKFTFKSRKTLFAILLDRM